MKYLKSEDVKRSLDEQRIAHARFGREREATALYHAINKLDSLYEIEVPKEIVRCGECRYWKCVEEYVGDCERESVCYLFTAECDFCSYGQRREKGE